MRWMLLFIVCSFCMAVQAQPEQLPELNLENDGIDQLLKEANVPVLGLGFIRDSTLKQIRMYGQLRDGSSAPHNTLFQTASLTKPITAVTALILVERGLLDLDESLAAHWIDPDLAEDNRVQLLTPRIVLTHQTGFPNWRSQLEEGKLAFQFDPGTNTQYSGEGFEYLRRAIEQKLNRPFESIVREFIFTPLDMTDSYLVWPEVTPPQPLAVGHGPDGSELNPIYFKEANAADGLVSTVEDYATFLTALLNGQLVSDSTFQTMVTPVGATDPNSQIGLSWEVFPNLGNGAYGIMHTGADPGYRALVCLLPDSGDGIVMLANGENILPVWLGVIANYFGEVGMEIISRK